MSNQPNPNPHAIAGYIVLRAEMQTISPLRIGSGLDDRADVEVIRWPDTNQPYVPAAGFLGALYHRYRDEVEDPAVQRAAEILWGGFIEHNKIKQSEKWQSHLRASDMDLIPPSLSTAIGIRDGVRIDPKTNTADDGKKFDYEFLEPGYTFVFEAEITLRHGFAEAEKENIAKLVAFLKQSLQKDLRIGGKTTRGFGEVLCEKMGIYHFDFVQGDDAQLQEQRKLWFEYLKGDFIPSADRGWDELPQLKNLGHFSMKADFQLRSSLLIGAPGDKVDKAQLRSNGQAVVSGTSLAGVIRHRSLKILQTLDVEEALAHEWLGNLFGEVDENPDPSKRRKAKKSRLRTAESQFRHECPEQHQQQTRIRVDSFAGGVIRGGLFDSQPILKQAGQTVQLRIDLPAPQPWEPALLMHLLKDLWTGDLPIGGEKSIGRGVLEGQHAKIHFNENKLVLKTTETGIALEASEDAQALLNASEAAFEEKIKSTKS